MGDHLDYNQLILGYNCTVYKCETDGSISIQLNKFNCSNLCFYNPWSVWSSCPSCSQSGPVYRSRSRESENLFNMKDLICLETEEKQLCDIPACNCTNGYDCPCVLSEWSNWSICSKSCGLGFQTRNRSYLSENLNCSIENLSENKDCNPQCCPGFYK